MVLQYNYLNYGNSVQLLKLWYFSKIIKLGNNPFNKFINNLCIGGYSGLISYISWRENGGIWGYRKEVERKVLKLFNNLKLIKRRTLFQICALKRNFVITILQ